MLKHPHLHDPHINASLWIHASSKRHLLWIHGSPKKLMLEPSVEPCPSPTIIKSQGPRKAFTVSSSSSSRSVNLPVFDERALAGASVADLARFIDKCRKEQDHLSALRLHAYMRENGLEAHAVLGNHLVSMLAEIGSIHDAQNVFDVLVCRNDRSWNSIITGYIKHGLSQQAFTLYERMHDADLVHFNAFTAMALLKASAELKDLKRGCVVHAEIERKGLLERNVFVGSALVDMYAKCGSIVRARQVFDRLLVRDVVSWNALITGYVNYGLGTEALSSFEQMQSEGAFPNAVTFVCTLKACWSTGAINKGLGIHAEIEKKGLLERGHIIGSALVDMYAKCDCLVEARQVFDCLSVRDVISWTALIAGYVEHGHEEKALDCFGKMHSEGVFPDAFTFVCCLRACGSTGAIDKGKEIHAAIEAKGLENNAFIGSALVDFYAKCGLLNKAQQVFDELPTQDMVSWNALMAGYVEHGHNEEALKCFDRMQDEGVPDASVYASILKACGRMEAMDKGQEVHAETARLGLAEKNVAVGSALVDMYAKCGVPSKASQVFDKLPDRDVISWNALIAGYAEQGQGDKALEQFEEMQRDGVLPDPVTFVSALKACGSIGDIEKGAQLHAEIERKGLVDDDNQAVGNTLIGMYAGCGLLQKAQEVFDTLPIQDIVSWNGLIAGYLELGEDEEAVEHFGLMQVEGISPDAVTFVIILKACGNLAATVKGQEVHVELERLEVLWKSPQVSSALVNMYVKFGLLMKAQQVFDKLPFQDVATWNTLLAGYAEHGHGEEVLNIFDKMQQKGVPPNVVTYVCCLKACSSIRALDKGEEIHAEILRKELLRKDLVIGNILIDMYAKCGLVAQARKVFDDLPVHDVISWTALIAGYADCGRGEEALQCLEKMHSEGVHPNAVTLVCSIKACGSIGATDRGQELHAEIERKGLLEVDDIISSALVDMYIKCGSLFLAQQVFDTLPVREVAAWNVLISGYAEIGESENVFRVFDRMIGEGLIPDPITFIIVLSACSRKGLFEKSQTYFDSMSHNFGLVPMVEHHSCVLDLFLRVGQLEKAIAAIKEMPFCPNLVMWHTVLSACRMWGNVEVGLHAFKCAMLLDEMDSAAHVLMSHIYAGAGMHDEAKKVEAMRVEKLSLLRTNTHSKIDGTKDVPLGII